MLLLDHETSTEAQPFLYGENKFIVDNTTTLHGFCAKIGVKNCNTMTKLELQGWGCSGLSKAMNHAAFTLMANATNLVRLDLRCDIGSQFPQSAASRFFRDAWPWLEAVGLAKGKKDAAVKTISVEYNMVAFLRELKRFL